MPGREKSIDCLPARRYRRGLMHAARSTRWRAGVLVTCRAAIAMLLASVSLVSVAGRSLAAEPASAHTAQAVLNWSSPVQVDTGLAFPNSSGQAHPMACPLSNLCVMVNGSYALTTATPQGRASGWAAQLIDPGNVLTGVACAPKTNDCIAIDDSGNILTGLSLTGGSTSNSWQPQTVDSAGLTSISCPSLNFCAITDSAGAVLNSTNPFTLNSQWPNSLVILTTNLPDATQSAAYSAVPLTSTGGLGPFTWYISSGQLPQGMCLYPAGTTTGPCPQAVSGNAAIAGTPLLSGTFSFTVTVTDSSTPPQTNSVNLTLVVLSSASGAPAPNSTKYLYITNSFLPATNVGTPYTALVNTAEAGATTPYIWTLSGAPSWLTGAATCSSTTCQLSGTPPVGGLFTFTLTVTDSTTPTPLTYTATFRLEIRGPSPVQGSRPLSVATTNLPEAEQNVAYSALGAYPGVNVALSATGGVPPYTWSLAAGSLPTGLTLATASGTINGTPTAPGTYPFTAQVTDSNGSRATASLSITVVAASRPLTITNTFLSSATVGSTYSQTLAVAGTDTAPNTWTITAGSLPTGLSLTPATGAISGTPTTTGSYNFTVKVTDSAGPPPDTATANFTIVVYPAAIGLSSISCSSTTFCAATDVSGDVYVTSNPSGASPSWLGPTPIDNPNPLIVLTTNLPLAVSGSPYNQSLTASIGSSNSCTGCTWSLVSSNLTGSGLSFSAGTLSGTAGAVGTYSFTAQVTDPAGASASVTLSVTVTAAANPLTVTTTFLPVATLGGNYSSTLAASGGTSPYTWSQTGGNLPLGLTLSSSGTISGVPTATGTYNFTVKVTDSAGPPPNTATANFTIVVLGTAPSLTAIACPSPSLCEATDQLGNVFTSTDPLAATTSAWTATDQDGGGKPINDIVCPSVTFCLLSDAKGNVVSGSSSFEVTTAALPMATVGVSYSATLSAANGVPLSPGSACPSGGTAGGLASTPPSQGFCWSVVSGGAALANAGLTVAAGGTISGLPTIPGTFLLTVQATDANGATAQAQVSLTVTLPSSSSNLAASVSTLPQGTEGEPYVTTLGATGGTPPYNWAVAAGSLPPGLALGSCPGSSCGVISGTPSAFGTFSFTLQVSDSSSPPKSESVSETITIPPALVWSPPVHADPRTTGNAINGLACVSSSLCVFADSGGNVESSTEPSGPPSAWVTAANQITALSCPNSNLCIAADSAGNLLSWNNYSASTRSACPAGSACWALETPATTPGLVSAQANALSCDPSSTVCAVVSASNSVVTVGQGSVSPPWSVPAASLTTNVGPRPMDAVSCPTSTLCIAGDSLGHIVTLNLPLPGSFSSANQPPDKSVDLTNAFTGISCPSLNLCVATDNAGNILSSTDPVQGLNATWNLAPHADASREIDAISCPSTSLCVAVDAAGNVLYSSNPSGGSSAWTLVSGVDDIWINSISCPSTTFCAAVDGAGNVLTTTTPTGKSSGWTKTDIDGSQSLNAIACATSSACVAVDAQGQVVAGTSSNVSISLPPGDGGVYSFPNGLVPTVAVGQTYPGTTTTSECASASNTSLPTALCASGGTPPYTWTVSAGSLPPGVCLYPQGTSSGTCPASVSSAAAVTAGIPTSTGNYTFTIQVTDSSSPPQSATISGSITVSSPGTAGSFGWMLEGNGTANPPAAPGISPLADGTNPLDAISCESVESCLVSDAKGNTLSTSTAQSAALPNVYPLWTAPAQTDVPVSVGATPLHNILALSCPPMSQGVALCVAGDEAGNLLTTVNPWGGTPASENWCKAVAASTNETPAITSPTCDSATLEATESPTPLPSIDPGNQILGISCPSVTLCVAVDSAGNAITTTNADVLPPIAPTWTVGNIEVGQHSAINAVSCPTTSLCVAVDSAGDVITSSAPSAGSGTWSLAHVDSMTGTVTLRGSATTNPPNSNPVTLSGLTSVSCATATMCVAVDAAGNVVASTNPTGGASAWTMFPVDSAALDSVSCPSTNFCMAVDDRGEYVDSLTAPTGGSSGWNTTGCPCQFKSPSSATPLDATAVMNSVSCPSAELCLATDQNGNVVVGVPSVPLEVVTTQLPNATVGNPYSQSVVAIGGTAPYSWSLPAGANPQPCPGTPGATALPAPGLCLSSSGTVSGTPTAAGTYSFTVLVTDSSNPPQSAVQRLTLTVQGSALQVQTQALPQGYLDSQYTAVLSATGGTAPYTWSLVGGVLPTGLFLTSTGTIFGKPTTSGGFSITVQVTDSSTPPLSATAALALSISSTPQPTGTEGYLLAGSNGVVFPFGSLSCPGSQASPCPSPATPAPGTWVSGIAPTPDGRGYWLSTSSGGVFTTGDATFFGSVTRPLAAPVVGISSTPDGNGYWLVGADGGVFAFGDAGFFGSEAGQSLGAPVVGMAVSPNGLGYWLVGADGAVFTFGDAGYYGSCPAAGSGCQNLNAPVVAMAVSPNGRGYWLVGADGAVFTFGNAGFFGSVPGLFTGSLAGFTLAAPVVAVVATFDGNGYWLVGADGGVFTFGDAQFLGSRGVQTAVPPIAGNCNPPKTVGACQIVAAAP